MEDLVVVVLLNYNQNEYTFRCIESLLESDYANFRIVLIDNGSSQDNADDLIKKLPKNDKLFLKRIGNNIGYSQGTNLGLQTGIELDPSYFLIMNNDTIIDKSAIRELVKTCKNNNDKALVTGKVYHYDEPDKLQFVGYKMKNRKLLSYEHMGLNESDDGQYDHIEKRDMIDDIFVLQPVKLYKEIGGYSPYLWINGVNIDMALRAIEKGFKLIYTPYAKIWHKGSISIGGRNMNPKLVYWEIESSLMLGYLYLSKSRFLIYYLRTLESIGRTFFKSIYLRWFKQQNISRYANAKFRGLMSFNKWVFNKNDNTGYNPF